MAKECNRCGTKFDWGQDDRGKWIPLKPLDSEFLPELVRRYLDSNGELRADHRERCGGMPLQVKRLNEPVQPEAVPEQEPFMKRMAGAAKVAVGRG